MSSLTAESLLIGSSNVYRTFKPESCGRPYKMIKCTKSETFEAHMSNLAAGNKFVLVSVVENFIADEVTNFEEPDAEITHCLRSFFKTVGEAAARLPGTKFGIVMPTHRPAIEWYQDRLKDITNNMGTGVKEIQKKNGFDKIKVIECSSTSTQDFQKDGVHLTDPAAKIFLDHILSNAENFFAGIRGEEDQPAADEDVVMIKSLEDRLEFLERAHKKQVQMNLANNLMMARVREELDAATNRSKEDRVVMNGLKSKDPIPVENRQRIEWLKGICMKIFEELVPNFPGKIFYLSQGKQLDVYLPMVEVKLDKVEHAMAVRKSFALKRKNKSLTTDLEALFVTNCVNLATRVRIDVLKAIARKISNDKDLAYVSGFISRPMMHIKKAGTPANVKPLKSFTFIDAVSRFHNTVSKEDLVTAYERAGRAFDGQLENNFVVLNEVDQRAVVGSFSAGSAGSSGGARGGGARGGGSGRGFSTGTNSTPRGSGSGSGSGYSRKRPGSGLEGGRNKK